MPAENTRSEIKQHVNWEIAKTKGGQKYWNKGNVMGKGDKIVFFLQKKMGDLLLAAHDMIVWEGEGK